MSQGRGAVTAFVREVDAKLGRVRVEYRAMEEGLESPWAAVASPLAGPKRGMLFMPEVGDEVLVLHGDNAFDHPFVLGYLWNGEQRSPETDPKLRVIKTPGGHQLRFEDVDNARKVVLRSDGGRKVTLDDNPAFGKIDIESGSNRILLDDNPGSTVVKLQAGSGVGVTVTLSATPQPSLSISVGAGTSINVDATGVSLTSPGLASITVTGAATVTCSSATVNAAAMTLNAAALSVNGGIATFTGVVQCSTLVTNAVVSPLYTPGIGNLI
jgi:phage baseplate assembly protein gpV